MRTVRAALWPMLERARNSVTPELEVRLHAELKQLSPHMVAHALQLWRPVAMELARASKARERQALIDRYASDKAHWALYAQAAWIARTIALAEYLESADLAILPKKWAGQQALSMVDDFEADESWLWPFESEPPWPDEDEDDDDDDDSVEVE